MASHRDELDAQIEVLLGITEAALALILVGVSSRSSQSKKLQRTALSVSAEAGCCESGAFVWGTLSSWSLD